MQYPNARFAAFLQRGLVRGAADDQGKPLETLLHHLVGPLRRGPIVKIADFGVAQPLGRRLSVRIPGRSVVHPRRDGRDVPGLDGRPKLSGGLGIFRAGQPEPGVERIAWRKKLRSRQGLKEHVSPLARTASTAVGRKDRQAAPFRAQKPPAIPGNGFARFGVAVEIHSLQTVLARRNLMQGTEIHPPEIILRAGVGQHFQPTGDKYRRNARIRFELHGELPPLGHGIGNLDGDASELWLIRGWLLAGEGRIQLVPSCSAGPRVAPPCGDSNVNTASARDTRKVWSSAVTETVLRSAATRGGAATTVSIEPTKAAEMNRPRIVLCAMIDRNGGQQRKAGFSRGGGLL